MSAIIRYIINMTPYMLIVIPIYLVGRISFLKVRKLKVNWLIFLKLIFSFLGQGIVDFWKFLLI